MTESIRQFEWDPAKSAVNLEKHGMDFATAKALWDDPKALTAPAKITEAEPRYMTVAHLDGKLWSAIHTYRDGRIRIISVRRSRPGEAAAYAQAVFNRKPQK